MKPSDLRTAMAKERGHAGPAISQEITERAPAGWREVQNSVAESSGISLLLVEGHQPPALAVTNNNSICRALQSSRRHVKLCNPFCGEAHERAIAADTITHYRCHAGLQCFAMPVKIDSGRQLAVIGGRAFERSSDYRVLADRVRSGDLQDLAADDLFQNVIFADESDLDHAALRLTKAAAEFGKAGGTHASGLPAGKKHAGGVRAKKTQTAATDSLAGAEAERKTTDEPRSDTDDSREAGLANSIRTFA